MAYFTAAKSITVCACGTCALKASYLSDIQTGALQNVTAYNVQ